MFNSMLQTREEKIKILEDNKFFDFKNGTITISFSPEGTLMDVDIYKKIYKRKFDKRLM